MSATAETAPKRILFVDDEQYVLDGMRDALRPHRHRWAMRFVASGPDALEVLSDDPQDVIVSDLRMPGMDGASLLERVRDVCPTAVRIVLSGHAEVRMVARAAAVAHRLLAKPCEVEELAQVIDRSCALRELSERVELHRRTSGASALPSVPRLYLELTELLATTDVGAKDVARVVESDMAMVAKVLQLANSAYFGRRDPVSKVHEAVAYLGLEALRALALQAGAFGQFRIDPPIPGFDLDALQRHSTRVARLASALAAEHGGRDGAFTAGLLHDVGLLILAAQEREALAPMLAAAHAEQRPLHEIERERHGVTHAEIGAHLLALWGLPHKVTEAVAHHHVPPAPEQPFDAVAATYFANVLIDEVECADTRLELDDEYLTSASLEGRLAHWRELAKRVVEDGSPPACMN